MTTYSLRPNVAVEPGVQGWYAWSHLVAPHTSALLRKNHYRPIVESYLKTPEAHAKALNNPRMQGGPFIRGGDERYGVIARWWDSASQQSPLDTLAEALDTLEQEVLPQFHGEALTEAYQRVPEPLQGLVELFYERDNVTAAYRLIEPLVYAEFGDSIVEHVRFFTIDDDHRDFALATPLLAFDDGQLSLPMPLASPELDRMFVGGLNAAELDQLEQSLGVPATQHQLFRSYFVEDSADTPRPASSGTRVRYAGHACVLVEHHGTSLLIDPVLSYSGYGHEHDERLTFESLPDVIDAVVISHNHQDHMLLETLLRIRHKVREVIVPESTNGTVLDPSLPLILERLGFVVTGLREFQERRLGSMTVTSLPFVGEHGDLRIQSKSCFHVRADARSLVFAADATNINPKMYDRVSRLIGDIDILFIGMECVGAPVSWLYGPLFRNPLPRLLDQNRRLRGSDFEQARRIVDAMGAREVYVYAMGQEPWLGAVMCIEYDEEHPAMVESGKLVDHLRANGIRGKRLFRFEEIVSPS